MNVPLLQETARRQDAQSPAQREWVSDLKKHPGLRSETVFVPGEWKLHESSDFRFLSVLFPAVPRVTPGAHQVLGKYPKDMQ